ncbi:extracellular solute-binding protein [Hydrogenophaga sp.]|uniref:extracellular solute-binding protein n=1 Tax=Hydrogenophaga sp. TaxID=1904254 RepID=UPI0027317CEF|nr:extracellular solute-binding protein [Hydrogenophaga sp.]MDP2015432.1 extracellular solute-binding protein [Hydrogenophaga sp.]MDP3164478.1 extracellular solute-binding protein [Hydrogenophaga sp.]MDP3810152.1 extracellular solute-binding protein [Hydrogenophaga sp.]
MHISAFRTRPGCALLCVLGAGLLGSPAWAEHAYAQFGDIKYPPGFTHFSYVNPSAPKGGEIRLVPPIAVTNFDKFNPFTLKGTPPAGLTELVFESLLTGNLEEPSTGYGLLADDVTVAPDRLSATFRIRAQARFNDGTPVLAADVVHSFKTLISPQASPQFRTIFADIKDVKALSERVVRFEFVNANRELPLLAGSVPVFSRNWGGGKAFDAITTDLPIGSGPYQPSSARLGRDITYVRDKAYWGADLAVRKGQYNFDRVTYKLYLDDTGRFEGLKAGEFDLKREFISRNWARQYTGRVFDSGAVKKQVFEHRNPGDFQGYVFNLRNPKFQDVRVRQAIALAMDFEWLNRQMFYGLYKRVEGYFPNSEFHAEGLPGPDELALLEPLRQQLRPEVFGAAPRSPSTAPPSSLRENLRKAQQLLRLAGWTYRDGALRNAQGEPFQIEYLNAQPSSNRLVAPTQIALRKLGIELRVRNVDGALYQQRMDDFDFELGSLRVPGSNSPGSTLFEYFGAEAAKTPGSANMWGIADPAVDALIRAALAAPTRPELAAAMRALDRVLSHGHYSIPQWYSDAFFVGYRPAGFVLPPTIPPFYQPDSWAVATWWASAVNR